MTPDEYDTTSVLIDAPPEEWDQTMVDRILARRAAQARALEEMAELWNTRLAEMTAARDEVLAPMAEQVARLDRTLEVWAMHNRTDRTKSWRLPSGAIETRAGRERLEVNEDEIPAEWFDTREVVILRKDAIKEHIKTTGEAVPGAALVTGEPSVKITTRTLEEVRSDV